MHTHSNLDPNGVDVPKNGHQNTSAHTPMYGRTANELSFASSPIFAPKQSSEVLFNTCTKFYPDGVGGWYPVKQVIFDRLIYNPHKMERHQDSVFDDVVIHTNDTFGDDTKLRNDSEIFNTFWKKSYYRARQQCYDYLMCNPDLNTFVTFTFDPQKIDSCSYPLVVSTLSVWLSNRVRRNGLKYVLVPEKHKSGAIHFHGITNSDGLKLIPSGYWKVGKYTLPWEKISPRKRNDAQEIFNVKDMPLGFSTALHVDGEDSQVKISKYIWKYMTKQGGQKIGGRFYLHGGDLALPKLVYSNELFEGSDGTLVTYGATACKIQSFNS